MSTGYMKQIREQAQRELNVENERLLVDKEKARLRASRTRWARLTAWFPFPFPFTITIHWRSK